MLRFVLSLLVAGAAMHAPVAHGQAFPNKPIRIIVGFPPGFTDVPARLLGDKLKDKFQQAIVVENRPGAGSVIASHYVKDQPGDGYTLYFIPNSPFLLPPIVSPDIAKYDPQADFTPIARFAAFLSIIAANAGFPARNVKELVDYAKANPGKVTVGTTGVDTGTLAPILLAQRTGVTFTHVPYQGSGPMVTDLLSGQINIRFNSYGGLKSHIDAGKLRILAVTLPTRAPALPDVPTVEETVPGVTITESLGMVGPKGMPPDITNRLSREFLDAAQQPDVRAQFDKLFLAPWPLGPEGYRDNLKANAEPFARIVRENNIKPQ